MNGAYRHSNNLDGRIGAVVKDLLRKFEDQFIKTGNGPKAPDQADIAEAIRPFLKQWELQTRIDEVRTSHSHLLTERVKQLGVLLHEAEKNIPAEFHS